MMKLLWLLSPNSCYFLQGICANELFTIKLIQYNCAWCASLMSFIIIFLNHNYRKIHLIVKSIRNLIFRLLINTTTFSTAGFIFAMLRVHTCKPIFVCSLFLTTNISWLSVFLKWLGTIFLIFRFICIRLDLIVHLISVSIVSLIILHLMIKFKIL